VSPETSTSKQSGGPSATKLADGGAYPAPLAKYLGRVPYEPTWRAMQDFTARRTPATPDELWVLEHPGVFTLGLAGKREHLLGETPIPVVHTDRGGQVTYHGPGQIIVYTLLDLRRLGFGVRELVRRLEAAVIKLLADYKITARGDVARPGVYVDGAKIAALGLRVKSGCTYHGLALNVDMDLTPFEMINPCGYPQLPVTQLRDLGVDVDIEESRGKLVTAIQTRIFP
jgi:lipoyl(octanoyl) transferase